MTGAELQYVPNAPVVVEGEENINKVFKILDALDDLDDVTNVHTNADLGDEE